MFIAIAVGTVTFCVPLALVVALFDRDRDRRADARKALDLLLQFLKDLVS
ncbi:MAG TPA: hypothetical protein VFG35_10575 [Actinoplanes sp.]|nr:hypothetical protein [Actinoplanes sp.]